MSFSFAHMEEIDLCWRMKNRGYKILVEPASVVFHIGGGTLSKSDWHEHPEFQKQPRTYLQKH